MVRYGAKEMMVGGRGMLRFLDSGDTAMVVEFGYEIDRAVSGQVLVLAERIAEAGIAGVIETVPTFRSLMVHYDPVRIARADLERRIAPLTEALAPRAGIGRLWRLPACYEPAVGPDVADVAGLTGLTPAQVIECHSAEIYHVYMVGFLPGFPYMGDLPKPLQLSRRDNPRVVVPSGSIAIAGAMTGVYTLESPGGWHLLGRTPVAIWDLRREPPVLLAPGDKVKFEPVSLVLYQQQLALAKAGQLQLSSETLAGDVR